MSNNAVAVFSGVRRFFSTFGSFIIWGILTALFVVFFLLNTAVPFYSDDINWVNHVRGDSFFEAQKAFYMNESGRLMNGVFWQASIEGGERCYDTLITVCLFIATIFFSLAASRKVSPVIMVLFLAVCLYLAPEHQTFFYWTAGGSNYLWPLALILPCLYCFEVLKRKKISIFLIVLFCLLAFFAGMTHEIFSIPISCAFVYYFISTKWNRSHLRKNQLLFIIAFGLGTLITLVSPGIWSRFMTSESESMSLLSRVLISFKAFKYCKCLYLLLILVFYLAVSKKQSLRSFIKDETFLFICLICAFGIYSVLGKVASRGVWSIEVFSLLLIVKWFNGNCKISGIIKTSAFVLCTVMLLHHILLIPPFRQSWNTYKQVELLSKQLVDTDNCVPMPNWHSGNWVIDRFVAHPYEMVREDKYVREALGCTVVNEDDYKVLANIDEECFSGDYALLLGSDFYTSQVTYQKNIDAWRYNLYPVYNNNSEGVLSYIWHGYILQRLFPARYPLTISVRASNVTKIVISGKEFVRFEKPCEPIPREIKEVIFGQSF